MNDLPPAAVLDFYATLPQQGPGSDTETRAVLDLIADRLPRAPEVADLGCGTGRSTLVLAECLKGRVTAVDLSEAFCTRLRAAAASHGLAESIDVRQADMGSPPIDAGALDLLWSEGAAYVIGFPEALNAWHSLLRPGAFCVVSECSWLSEDRPEAVSSFWRQNYPAMGTAEDNIRLAQDAGYEVEASRILSGEGWQNYYGPIKQAVAEGRAAHLGAEFVDGLREEMAIFEMSGGCYGYVFYVMRKPARAEAYSGSRPGS